MTYVVIRYSKRITLSTDQFDFHIYSKRSMDRMKLLPYYNEIQERHEENCFVHLVTEQLANKMKKMWADKLRARDQAYLDMWDEKYRK